MRCATATISGGGTYPNCGWFQRSRASKPVTAPVRAHGLWLVEELEGPLTERDLQVGRECEAAGGGVAVLGTVGRHPGAGGLGGVHRDVGLGEDLVAGVGEVPWNSVTPMLAELVSSTPSSGTGAHSVS